MAFKDYTKEIEEYEKSLKWLLIAEPRYPETQYREENMLRDDYTEVYPDQKSVAKRIVLQMLRDIKEGGLCFSPYKPVIEKDRPDLYFGIVLDDLSEGILGKDYQSVIFPSLPFMNKVFGEPVEFAFINYDKFYNLLVQYCSDRNWDFEVRFTVVNFDQHALSDCYLAVRGWDGQEFEYATPCHTGYSKPLDGLPEHTIDFADGEFTIDGE